MYTHTHIYIYTVHKEVMISMTVSNPHLFHYTLGQYYMYIKPTKSAVDWLIQLRISDNPVHMSHGTVMLH